MATFDLVASEIISLKKSTQTTDDGQRKTEDLFFHTLEIMKRRQSIKLSVYRMDLSTAYPREINFGLRSINTYMIVTDKILKKSYKNSQVNQK